MDIAHFGQITKVFCRHGTNTKATTHTYVLIEEIGTLGVNHRGSTEINTQLSVACSIELQSYGIIRFLVEEIIASKGDILSADANTHRYAKERRILCIHLQIVAQQASALEQDVAQSIAQLCREDTDTCTRHHVTHPVAVVQHAHHTCRCCYTIASHREPRRTGEAILLVEQGSTNERGSRMTRRP